METKYGKEFYTCGKFNENWIGYDQMVARSHMSRFGVIVIDEFGQPIDNEFDLNAIELMLK